jgi:hypothetical protein
MFFSKTLPKSPLGKAITYTVKRWDKLCIYTTNGILQIDNNLVENSIRLIALGRKNYLFAGSHERAQDAAMLYSLFATCRLHNINPEQWLTNLFENINSTPKDQLQQLLPQIISITPDSNEGVRRRDTTYLPIFKPAQADACAWWGMEFLLLFHITQF